MNGISTLYYENSQIKRIENYKNDEFIDGKCFDENGTEITFFLYKPISRRYKRFYKYVGENFKSPNTKGQIKVAFVVQIDGTLKDFKIIEGQL
jgi:antitoxin component YwqK of YwqJK toxin-antitoxin module